MLQWMGGSKRKVITSRKSIQNRQKHYFEQRKRQQQTDGLENNANGRSKRAHEHRSLDILSLTNLAAGAQECGSGDTINARENSEARDPQENYHALRCFPNIPIDKITSGDSSDLNEEKVKSTCYKTETSSPKKASADIHLDNVPSTPKHIKGYKPDDWKTMSKNQLSVLDILGDDGFPGCSEQRSAHEAHVAFSVEGLGIMGMETPAHSPRLSDRGFFNGCCTTPGARRRLRSSKNTPQVTDDFEVELNGIINGIGQSLGHSPSELAFNSRIIMDQDNIGNLRSTQLTPEGCLPLESFNYTVDNFLDEEEEFCSNMEERNEQGWNARSSFLDNFDERKHGIAWKNQLLQVDSDSDNFLKAKKYEISDYGLEDSCLLNERDAEKAWNKLNISDSPAQYFKHLPSEKDYDFIALEEKRYPVAHGSWDYGSISNQPVWSLLATKDAEDDVSLLSEESCSSSAVRGKQNKNSMSNLMKLKLSERSHGCEHWKSLGDNMNNLFADEMVHMNMDEVHQEMNLKRAGHHTRAPNLSRSKGHYLKELSKVQRVSEPTQSLLFKEPCTSVSVDSDLSSFHGTSREMDTASLKYKVWSEPHFDSFLVSKLYPDMGLSRKRSKSKNLVDHAPYASFFSEKDVAKQPEDPVLYDSDIFSSIKYKLWKPDIQPDPEVEAEPPYSSSVSDLQKDIEIHDLSWQHGVNKDTDELRSCSANCRQDLKEPQNEVSFENSDLPSGNGKSVDVADFKDSCSEHEEVKGTTPDPIEIQKTRNSPEPAYEPSSAMEENHVKLESSVNGRKYDIDSGNLVQYQIVNKDAGKENSGSESINIGSKGQCNSDQPYQVMLESYVLQLLCVQKVLKEASELDNVKKV